MALFTHPVRITWSYGTGSPGFNIWHGRTTGDWPSESDAESLSQIIKDFYSGLILYFKQNCIVSFDGEITGLGPNQGDSQTLPTWQVGGSSAAGALPTSQQICVDWTTGAGGRSGRGRTFFGPLSVAASDGDGLPAQACITAVNDAAAALVSASGGFANGALGVWSPKDGVLRDFVGGNARRSFAVLRSRRD